LHFKNSPIEEVQEGDDLVMRPIATSLGNTKKKLGESA
jgi:hypothetical protein